MGQYEKSLDKMFSEPRWRAPKLGPLSQALDALERALGDLSQADPGTWSGAAADGAAETFDRLRNRYGHMKVAIQNVIETVEDANRVRDRAYMEFADLPSATIPGYVYQQVQATRAAGQPSAWIAGQGYPIDSAIYQYGQTLEQEREAKARELYESLREELQPQQDKLVAARDEIEDIAARDSFDDEVTGSRRESLPIPKGYVPSPRGGGPVRPDLPDYPEDRYEFEHDHGGREYDRDRVRDEETRKHQERQPTGGGRTPEPSPRNPVDPVTGRPLDPWQRSSEGIAPTDVRYGGLDVDSGSRGTIGNPGLNGGLLGGAGLAGGAALRWTSQGGTMGPNAGGVGGPGGIGAPGGAGGIGGVGGIGGAGGAGGVGAPGGASSAIAGGRGLAGGLPGGGSGAAGAGPGSGAAAGAGARGGMVSGGTPMGGRGGGAGGGNNGKKSGLGGHIAPKLEDDEDFMPQSDSARAGSRDELED